MTSARRLLLLTALLALAATPTTYAAAASSVGTDPRDSVIADADDICGSATKKGRVHDERAGRALNHGLVKIGVRHARRGLRVYSRALAKLDKLDLPQDGGAATYRAFIKNGRASLRVERKGLKAMAAAPDPLEGLLIFTGYSLAAAMYAEEAEAAAKDYGLKRSCRRLLG